MGKPGDSQYVSKMFQSPFMDHSAVHGDGERYARAASESRHGEVIPRDILGTKYKGAAAVGQEVFQPFTARGSILVCVKSVCGIYGFERLKKLFTCVLCIPKVLLMLTGFISLFQRAHVSLVPAAHEEIIYFSKESLKRRNFYFLSITRGRQDGLKGMQQPGNRKILPLFFCRCPCALGNSCKQESLE